MNPKLTVFIFFLILFVVVQTQTGTAQEIPLKPISLVPQWIPQAQFAGYMVALEKGFYREAGLDLTLLPGGPGKPPFQLLAEEKATFCTGWLSNAIELRASGEPIVALAQIIQRSALLLVAKKSSGINQPQDLNGKKVGLWAGHFYLQPTIFFRKNNIKVEFIPNYSSVALFLKGGLDAISAMWYNEYDTIINSGIDPQELTVIFMSDFGPSFPEDGLYTLAKTFETDPDMCRSFVEASLRGWIYAFDHTDEALDIVMKFARAAHTGTNRTHQRWMLARMKDLIIPANGLTAMGKLSEKDYEWVGEVLTSFGFIKQAPEFRDFYCGP
jgi:NitT/TauT family transport system substrate-binding protein